MKLLLWSPFLILLSAKIIFVGMLYYLESFWSAAWVNTLPVSLQVACRDGLKKPLSHPYLEP